MQYTASLYYKVDGSDLSRAGEAAACVKKEMRQLGIDPDIMRRVAIAMYEGEINMVIHANGGEAFVEITPEKIKMKLVDKGPGIADIPLAMSAGHSTADDEARRLGFGAGMGLPNMKNYTDELQVTSEVGKGTCVEMAVNL